MIETVSDVNNTFLSRRELVCNFAGLGGKLRKLEAVDMVSKEYSLDGKIVIPVRMASHVGKPLLTGTFYVYEDEELVKKQVDPPILARLERAKKKAEEASAAEAEAKDAPAGEGDGEKAAEAKDAPAGEGDGEKAAEAKDAPAGEGDGEKAAEVKDAPAGEGDGEKAAEAKDAPAGEGDGGASGGEAKS